MSVGFLITKKSRRAKPLGKREFVRAKIERILPSIRWTSEEFGVFEVGSSVMEVALGDAADVTSISLTPRGDAPEELLDLMFKIATTFRCVVFDEDGEELSDPKNDFRGDPVLANELANYFQALPQQDKNDFCLDLALQTRKTRQWTPRQEEIVAAFCAARGRALMAFDEFDFVMGWSKMMW